MNHRIIDRPQENRMNQQTLPGLREWRARNQCDVVEQLPDGGRIRDDLGFDD
jgi:hypothetical protein